MDWHEIQDGRQPLVIELGQQFAQRVLIEALKHLRRPYAIQHLEQLHLLGSRHIAQCLSDIDHMDMLEFVEDSFLPARFELASQSAYEQRLSGSHRDAPSHTTADIRSPTVSAIITQVVAHATEFWNREFVHPFMRASSLTSFSMSSSTNGSMMPLMTCVIHMMGISGTRGIITIIAPTTMNPV